MEIKCGTSEEGARSVDTTDSLPSTRSRPVRPDLTAVDSQRARVALLRSFADFLEAEVRVLEVRNRLEAADLRQMAAACLKKTKVFKKQILSKADSICEKNTVLDLKMQSYQVLINENEDRLTKAMKKASRLLKPASKSKQALLGRLQSLDGIPKGHLAPPESFQNSPKENRKAELIWPQAV